MRAMLMAVVVMAVGCGEGLERGEMHEVQGRSWEYPCPDDLEPIEDPQPCDGYSAAAEAYDGDGTLPCEPTIVGEFEGAIGCCIGHGGGTGYFHVCEEI